jgi:hypothetical protein
MGMDDPCPSEPSIGWTHAQSVPLDGAPETWHGYPWLSWPRHQPSCCARAPGGTSGARLTDPRGVALASRGRGAERSWVVGGPFDFEMKYIALHLVNGDWSVVPHLPEDERAVVDHFKVSPAVRRRRHPPSYFCPVRMEGDWPAFQQANQSVCHFPTYVLPLGVESTRFSSFAILPVSQERHSRHNQFFYYPYRSYQLTNSGPVLLA